MTKLWALLAILLTFTLTLETAHAKRMGSGKSFGKSYQTTPAPDRARADNTPQRQQAAAAPAQNSRKGLMGGLLGGLLVGGLFAALFAGCAFNGMQFMDFVLIGVLAMVILMLFKMWRQRRLASSPQPRRQAPQPVLAGAAAGGSPQVRAPNLFDSLNGSPAATTGAASAGETVPFRLPLNFDTPAFLQSAKENYRLLQDAWNQQDLAKIRTFVSPALFDELRRERDSLATAPETEILSLNAELGRATQSFGVAEISVRFSGRYRDLVEGVNEDFVDVWHLERDCTRDNTPWVITGIQSE